MVWIGITSHRADRCRTATSSPSTAGCATSFSMRACSSISIRPVGSSAPGSPTTTPRGRTPRSATKRRPLMPGRNTEADFHGKKRSNETHVSTTDPDARLYRKGPGKEAKLCFIGHGLMENRHGLLVDACLTPADGHAERVAALAMIEPRADRPRAITLGADKAYDAEDFVNELRSMTVTPHVAQNTALIHVN